jgi:hypothetical protein
VYHELVSDIVHIDVLIVPPWQGRDMYTLVTSGMSDQPMSVPEEEEFVDELMYAELVISLPSDWPLDKQNMRDENNYWPIRWLKKVARLPHEHRTWVGLGMTVRALEDERMPPDCGFAGVVLGAPMLTNEEFCQLKVSGGPIINFYSLVPLYQEEIELVCRSGLEALGERLGEDGGTELVNVGRRNVGKRRSWWFF